MTEFTRIIIFIVLAILANTDQGADPCMKHCADFHSDVCNGTNPPFPIYWLVNGQIVGGGNQTSPKSELSPRLFDTVNGYWMQSLTAYNVCVDPLIVVCQQGQEQLLFHNISFCEDGEIGTDSSTLTTNTNSDLQPQADKSHNAVAVLVPSLVVAVAVIVFVVAAVLLLIWLMRRPGCQARLPGNVLEDRERRSRTHILPASDGGDNLDDTNTPKAGANRKLEPSETVPPEQKSDGLGVMTRIPRDVVRNQPKSNISRDDAMIEVKVVETNSMSMPAIKPQVDNVNQSPNLCLPHGPTTVQECSDKYVLDPVFYHDGQISVMTGIPSAEKATCILHSENVPGREEMV